MADGTFHEMFSFGFDVDDAGDVAQTASSDDEQPVTVDSAVVDEVPAQEVDLDELFAALPARISYSPLLVRRNDGTQLYIARRDLFDARYQLMAGESDDVDAPDIQFLDAPSDLVRGVYEGGLKTWECASDLVQYISEGPAQTADSVLEASCAFCRLRALAHWWLEGSSVVGLRFRPPMRSVNSSRDHTTMHLRARYMFKTTIA